YTTLFRSRAVRANIVAAATSIVMIGGVRVGIVRRARFGARCEDAVETLFHALPPSACKRLIIVDARLATPERSGAPRAFCRRHGQGGAAGAVAHQLHVAVCPTLTQRQARPSGVARSGAAS